MKTLTTITEQCVDQCLGDDCKVTIIEKLKNALKEEFNAWYGYIITKDFLVGPQRREIAEFYEKSAKDELEDHAYWIMRRISELGGTVDDLSISPATWLSAAHSYRAPQWEPKYAEETGIECDEIVIPVKRSLLTNIENEKDAIATYKELVAAAHDCKDYTTERKCKQILADEEEHLQELRDYLADIAEMIQNFAIMMPKG